MATRLLSEALSSALLEKTRRAQRDEIDADEEREAWLRELKTNVPEGYATPSFNVEPSESVSEPPINETQAESRLGFSARSSTRRIPLKDDGKPYSLRDGIDWPRQHKIFLGLENGLTASELDAQAMATLRVSKHTAQRIRWIQCKQGWWSEEWDETDRRKKTLHRTDKGQKLLGIDALHFMRFARELPTLGKLK